MGQQNDSSLIDLEAKVHSLKDIALGINREAQESNSILGGMSTMFDQTGSMMKNTASKLKHMVEKKSGKHMLYLTLFIVGLFMLLWFLGKAGRGSNLDNMVIDQKTSTP